MKSLKLIIISVAITLLAAALVVTIACNKFILAVFDINDTDSFKKAIVSKELMESLQQLQSTPEETETSVPNTEAVQIPAEDSKPEETESEVVAEPESEVIIDTAKDEIIYEDDYVKITYVKQELSLFGPAIKFLVESKTDKTIDISFTDVHIDGFMVDLTGAYVSDLAEGKKSFETLYIYESDYEDFTEYPSMIEFTIKVQDSESWNSLAESEVIYMNIEQ